MQKPICRFMGWFLSVVLLSMVSLLINSYSYTRAQTSQKTIQSPIQTSVVSHLPSVIPSLFKASKHLFINRVDLRRADLMLALKDDDPSLAMQPLLDKVLIVPKLFAEPYGT